jgi:hypothetical protein
MKLLHEYYFRNKISTAEVPGARTKPTRTPHPLNQDRQPCFASITLAEHIKHYYIKHFHTPTAAPSHLPTEEDRFRNIISHDSNSWMLYLSTNKYQMTIIRMRLFKIRSSALLDAAQGEATKGTQGHWPHRQYLDLAIGMEVALLVCSTDEDVCVGLEIILECSPQGTWEGFRVPHRDYVVVRLTAVFPEYSHHASYCEIPDFRTLGDSVGYRILWSGYQVRPAHCSTPHV